LVLHGGSGIHPDDLRESIKMNVVMVNVGADVVRAWMIGRQEGALSDSADEPPHQFMMNHASKKVTQMARRRLSAVGASNHANPLLGELQEARLDLSAHSAVHLSV